MAKRRPKGVQVAHFQIHPEYLKKGKHSAVLFLPEAFHAEIGLIIAHWGQFEMLFNVALGALIDAEAQSGTVRDTEGWKRSQFKRRRTMFKEVCTEWLSTWKHKEALALLKISDRAGDLAWKRNMIAHGLYQMTILPHSSTAIDCVAVNEETNERFSFDLHVLRKLWHDIAHLGGDLLITLKSFAQVSDGFHAFSDTDLLRMHEETIRRQPPSADIPQPPPEPSRQ
jgi:hypothetical protein